MITLEIKLSLTTGSCDSMNSFLDLLNSKKRDQIAAFTTVMKDGLEKGLILDMVKNTFDPTHQTFIFHLFSENIDYANAFRTELNSIEADSAAFLKDLGISYTVDITEIPAFLAGGSIKISALSLDSYVP